MILIGQYDSPFVRRVAIALRLYGIGYEHRPWSTFGDADRIAAFNPLRRVPTLVLDDGESLRACQESCVEGRLQLNPLLCGEPFAEHDGELRLGGGPFAWRNLPLAAALAQHQGPQLGCHF